MISPTARATRGSSSSYSSQPAGPLAPSLAAELHLSESPANYFARKDNMFNLYFVKIGWLWTTVAFASLLLFQPAYRAASSSQLQQQARARRILQAFFRYAFATGTWYFMTQWFFGPAIVDRGFLLTGGKCEQALRQVGKADLGPSPSDQLETLFTAAACKTAGGAWRGGHDISGHVFMLVLATALLAFEAVGAGAIGAFATNASRNDTEGAHERKVNAPDSPWSSDEGDLVGVARKWSLRLVWGVVGWGWWMLFMTAIWFHTWLEKVSGDSLPKLGFTEIYPCCWL